MTHNTDNPNNPNNPRELTDAELELVSGGKPRGYVERQGVNAYGGTTTSSYAWRGRRFRPRRGDI